MGKGAATRERILDEAMRIASRDGLEGLTIGTLAKALSLSKSGLFVHFGSKEALQVAVLEHCGERFRQLALAPLLSLPPGPARIRALFHGWMAWMNSQDLPGGCPLLAASFELDDRDGPAREVLVAKAKSTQELLTSLFQEVAPPGADVSQAVFEYRSITLGYHYLSRVMRDPTARERVNQAFEALIARTAALPPFDRIHPPVERKTPKARH